jgi:hypothetical protein
VTINEGNTYTFSIKYKTDYYSKIKALKAKVKKKTEEYKDKVNCILGR